MKGCLEGCHANTVTHVNPLFMGFYKYFIVLEVNKQEIHGNYLYICPNMEYFTSCFNPNNAK